MHTIMIFFYRDHPTISLDSVCTISLYELKKDRLAKKNYRLSMSVDAYKHYIWVSSRVVRNILFALNYSFDSSSDFERSSKIRA